MKINFKLPKSFVVTDMHPGDKQLASMKEALAGVNVSLSLGKKFTDPHSFLATDPHSFNKEFAKALRKSLSKLELTQDASGKPLLTNKKI